LIVCPNCSGENRPEAKFCGSCGQPLGRPCPACGTANDPGTRFCIECGSALAEAQADGPDAPVAAPQPVTRAPAPVAERRLVSVLFADLVGFTNASEARDAEATRELLSRYFDTCRRLIALYGGTVEKFIGDAVMAVWGTPTATEDDAERAVRAALDLVAAVTALGDEAGASGLRARAAVLTGEAAVTIGAEAEGMVAGDIVNTASRIQGIAEPGQVLVGESTRRATEAAIVYEDAGLHELKGKGGLVPAWRALRVVSGTRGTLKSQGLEAPFVGRDRELRLIKDLFHDSESGQRAHLISVTGIAGIGKSRLAWEFYKYFDGIAQLTYWHRGRCLSYGEGVTYWALADMVRMRARIGEEEEPASARAKLLEIVSETFSDDADRRFVEPRLAHLLGLEEGSGYERDDLFAAWRLFFERLTDTYPVVMSFEDMQWADDSLLDFIEYLLDSTRNSPILVLTLARPELHERRPTWGAARRNFTSLYLEPLSAAAMEELLTGLVPGLPEEVRAQILERAEGIPLYAVETVRMLLDRGLLVREGSVYRPEGTLGALEVPETLHALIAARLDGLPPEERRVLQDAAVLGKTFTKRALAALSSLSDDAVEPLLASLVRKEVLAVQADPRSPEHGQYGFLQDLVRHVAYETLSKRERRARHLAAASHLEASFADDEEIVEVLASHYLDAYRELPDAEDAGKTKAKAREMLRRAGERAASLAAAREAQRYFQQAAELTDEPLVRAELDEKAGRMAWRRGRGEEAVALFDEALAVLEPEGLVRPAARIAAILAEIDFREGRTVEAVERLERGLAVLGGEEPDAVVAETAAQLGRFLMLASRYEEAGARLELALELAEALQLPEILTQALTSKATLFTRVNRLEEARILLEGSLATARAHDLPAPTIRAINNLGVVYESSDRYAAAYGICEDGLELARRVGDRVWESVFLAGPISALTLLGRWDAALARAAEVEEVVGDGTPAPDTTPTFVISIECCRGNLVEARRRLDEVKWLEDGEVQAWTAYRYHEAQVLRAENKPREALDALEPVLATDEVGITFLTKKLGVVEALEAAFECGDTEKLEELLVMIESLRPGERPPLLDAHARRFRAKLSGDEAGFTAAATRFRKLDMLFWLAVTDLEHAERLFELGREAEAEPLLAEAQEIFARLEATPWLERAAGLEPEAQAQIPA
jgi:class 3 adenylate cyclase/tetratricopeptide (TPR) repeat protein